MITDVSLLALARVRIRRVIQISVGFIFSSLYLNLWTSRRAYSYQWFLNVLPTYDRCSWMFHSNFVRLETPKAYISLHMQGRSKLGLEKPYPSGEMHHALTIFNKSKEPWRGVPWWIM
ncbi:hypothetical protein L3X38_000012 [Prunus dulcis]|uniref:Uncharacterized protein n=1 Tax=Prunus dulcis TaxID=3755 RepID=A0AAD4YH91_PRUDU|nr:uncharacterized protein LOC117615302 [Prunus dulcis]XP_034200257.1 uncharacterized protein LOC117615302 [Prunus dulcis]XP_034200258.1 uncharacterized protein LOC117615302 [Prunus dulcis]XP_034200259.1 uncharacterized protein LOC117615302 [Prunus dulcis]KAI5311347.1 hypothetical protein L3X38_000012 [Prunus dulcis]